MKLTNSHREAFIRSAMNDVPKVDFKEEAERLILSAAVACLPPAVKRAYDDTQVRPYITTFYYNGGSGYSRPIVSDPKYIPNFYKIVPSIQLPGLLVSFRISGDIREKIEQLVEKFTAQETKLNTLQAKLKGVAYGATTRKALADVLPTFEKYLPPETPATARNLPAICNIVDDFTSAGWPKPVIS